jgi:hypothetical protein
MIGCWSAKIERWSVVATALATVGAACVAIFSLVASTRAWVGPTDVTLLTAEPAIISVDYRNAGKEPAQQFGDTLDDTWRGNVADGASFREADFEKKCISDSTKRPCAERILGWEKNCSQQALFESRVAFPDFKYTRTKPAPWFDRLDRNKIIFLQGCFVYRSAITPFSDHRTAFCYYYRVGDSDQKEAKMRPCPIGNFAY